MTEYLNNALDGEYYQGFDPQKQYQQLLFRSGKGLQSRELNDLQLQAHHQVKSLGDVLLKNGNIVTGGALAVNKQTQLANVGEADVYLNGAVHHIPETDLEVSVTGTVIIGVWLSRHVVTELTDPTLLDPAGKYSPVVAHNYDEPGAARLQVSGQWGISDQQLGENSEFYPVHQIDNGVVLLNSAPPQLDSVTRALARYDRESNGGSYVVAGMALSYLKTAYTGYIGTQFFSVQEGKAHINGYEVAFETALPAAFEFVPHEREITNEPTNFVPDSEGKMAVKFDFFPIKQVNRVVVTAKKTVQITRGHEPGGKDLLPDQSVKRILSVKQERSGSPESTEFIEFFENVSFTFTGNDISWQLGGKNPAQTVRTWLSMSITLIFQARVW